MKDAVTADKKELLLTDKKDDAKSESEIISPPIKSAPPKDFGDKNKNKLVKEQTQKLESKKDPVLKKKEKSSKSTSKKSVETSISKIKGKDKDKETKIESVAADKESPKRPEIEDSEGFNNRRPIKDPFQPGEKVVLTLTYFGAEAGEMEIEVRPFSEVNGRKAYTFVISAKSSKVFSLFYSVDDWAETHVDYETLLPITFSLHVKESKQIKEVRTFLNWNDHQALLWESKMTKDKGPEKRKLSWNLAPYSQNPFSAAFYLRAFNLRVGKTISFRVSDEGKEIIFRGTVLRKEILKTETGPLSTLVLEPTIEMKGIFSQVGKILFWLTDDDRKQIVRIESKIKIGTIVGTLKSLTR